MLLTTAILLMLLSGGALAWRTEKAIDRGERVSEFGKALPGALLVCALALLGVMLSLNIGSAAPVSGCCL